MTGNGVPLWGVQAGPAPTMPPATPRPAPTPPAVVLGEHDSADDVDTDLAAPAPVAKPVLGARLAVDVLPGGDVRGAGDRAAGGTASSAGPRSPVGPSSPRAPDPGLVRAAVGPFRETPAPSQPVPAPRPLPVQDVLPGRELLTAAPVGSQSGAGLLSASPAPTPASAPAGEADERLVAEVVAPVVVPAAVPVTSATVQPPVALPAALPVTPAAVQPPVALPAALPASVPPPVAHDGAGSGQPAPVNDVSTSLALLLATGAEAPPSTVPPAATAAVDVPHPVAGHLSHDPASTWQPVPGGEPLAAPPATGAAQEAAHLVPPQVRRRVELGFRDGSSTALDPDSEQALALAELSSLLTGRD